MSATANTTVKSKSSGNRRSSKKSKQAESIKSHQEMIAEAAYHLSEKRGFAPGYEQQDWLEAERIIHEQFPSA